MAMHNPPHPGEFISSIYLELNGISGHELAAKLDAHDLWQARQQVDLSRVGKLILVAA